MGEEAYPFPVKTWIEEQHPNASASEDLEPSLVYRQRFRQKPHRL
jgi:hypothetical protein